MRWLGVIRIGCLFFITVTDYDANNAQNDEKCAANSNGNETKQQSDDTDYVQNRAGSLIGFCRIHRNGLRACETLVGFGDGDLLAGEVLWDFDFGRTEGTPTVVL